MVTFYSIITFDFAQNWQCLFQDPATSIMENIIDLHHDITFFLVVIIIFVLYMLLTIHTNFTIHNEKAVRSPNLTHNTLIEIIWTLIPTFILLAIALPSYVLIYNTDDITEPQITLKIIGHQWYWSYEYSDYNQYNQFLDSAVTRREAYVFDSYMVQEADLIEGHLRLLEVDNDIVLPINTVVRFLITSSDVIHSWTIPSLGVKMDAVPGRLNQVGTLINRESSFYGQCSELCGINHSFMPIGLRSVTLEEYIQWLNPVAPVVPVTPVVPDIQAVVYPQHSRYVDPLHCFDPLEQFDIFQVDLVFSNLTYFHALITAYVIVILYPAARAEGRTTLYSLLSTQVFNFTKGLMNANIVLSKQFFLLIYPFMFTLVLSANIIGLIPYSFTITSSFVITFASALTVLCVINILAIYTTGFFRFIGFFLPQGTPIAIAILLVFIEVVSYMARLFSLSIRLFANMMAGHTLLKILIGFSFTMIFLFDVFSIFAILPWVIVSAIVVLEVLIACLQAYVFLILSCIYRNDILTTH